MRIRFFLIVCILCLASNVFAQTKHTCDSMIACLNKTQDSQKASLCNEICWSMRNSNPVLAIQYGMQALDYAQKYNDYRQICKSYSFIGVCYRNVGNYSDALNYYQLGLKVAQDNNIKDQIAYANINISNLNFYQGDIENVEYNLREALLIGNEINDTLIVAYCYLNIGRLYCEDYSRIPEGIEYISKSLALRKSHSSNDVLSIASCLKYLGDAYFEKQEFAIANKYYRESWAIVYNQQDLSLLSALQERRADICLKHNDLDSAMIYAYSALSYAKRAGVMIRTNHIYNIIANIYDRKQDFENAMIYYKNQLVAYDSLFEDRLKQKVINIEFIAQQYRKQQEINMLNQEKRSNNIIVSFLFVFLILFAFFIFMLLKINKKNKKINEILNQKNEENEKNLQAISIINKEIGDKNDVLEEQKVFIEEQNQLLSSQQYQIRDSIVYAKRIQDALLPSNEIFENNFKDYFVLYKPRDVVSGDFYWVKDDLDYTILALGDCTGHGVPGAFMSMLGISALYEIFGHIQNRKSSFIMEEMRKMVKNLLQQKISNISYSNDGIDLAICVINKKTKVLDYCGANIPLIIIRDGLLKEYSPDRNPVGIYLKEEDFHSQIIQLYSFDKIYLSSDGFTSQFGDVNRTKFKMFRYRKMLEENYSLPMKTQCSRYENIFNHWKGNNIQFDDILVIGVEV